MDEAGRAYGGGDTGGGLSIAGKVACGKGDKVEGHAGLRHEVVEEDVFCIWAGLPAVHAVALADVSEAPLAGVERDAETTGTGQQGAGGLRRNKIGLR